MVRSAASHWPRGLPTPSRTPTNSPPWRRWHACSPRPRPSGPGSPTSAVAQAGRLSGLRRVSVLPALLSIGLSTDRCIGRRTEQRGNLVRASPGQRDAGAAVPVTVHDPRRPELLDFESHGWSRGSQTHLVPQHFRARELRYEHAGSFEDPRGRRRIRRTTPLALLVGPADHDVA